MKVNITLIPALADNYIYLLDWKDKALVIDPAEASPVIDVLNEKDIHLAWILNTHHHMDHIGGNCQLKEMFQCELIAPEDPRIPDVDRYATEEEKLIIDSLQFQIFFVPGHTSTHIAYYLPNSHAIFSGDSLFNGGCGRLFEGTPEQMLQSLQKLMKLPKETLVYSGHEYTLKNLRFAASIEPTNEQILTRLQKVERMRQAGEASIPSTLEEELETNPFLRVHSASLKETVKMTDASDVEVFAHIREMRDVF